MSLHNELFGSGSIPLLPTCIWFLGQMRSLGERDSTDLHSPRQFTSLTNQLKKKQKNPKTCQFIWHEESSKTAILSLQQFLSPIGGEGKSQTGKQKLINNK